MKAKTAKQRQKVASEFSPDFKQRISEALIQSVREAQEMNFKRLLAATDFSELSMEAVEYAVALGKEFAGAVSLIHVVEPSPGLSGMESVVTARTDSEILDVEKRRLSKLAKQLSQTGRAIKAVTRYGKPFREIATEALEQKVDLIVTGTHGHSGLKRVLLGSTAEWVVRHAPCPVLTVPAETADRLSGSRWVARIKRILVPIDFSKTSLKALSYASALASKFGAEVAVIHVTEPPSSAVGFDYMPAAQITAAGIRTAEEMLSTVQREAFPENIRTEAFVQAGTPFHEITRAAARMETDLIILTTHGRTGLKHVVMGSTAERIVRHAGCPVLVVRDKEATNEARTPSKPHKAAKRQFFH